MMTGLWQEIVATWQVLVAGRYWSPLLIGLAGLVLGSGIVAVATNPLRLHDRRYKRWMLAGGLFVAFSLFVVLAYSFPYLAGGLIIGGGVSGAIAYIQMKQRFRLKDELLNYMTTVTGLMTADQTYASAVRATLVDKLITETYPRIVNIMQDVVLDMDARGVHISDAMFKVSDSLHDGKDLWEQITITVAQFKHGSQNIETNAQKTSLNLLLEANVRREMLEQEMKREMGAMTMAQWLFTIIIPAMNVYQYFVMPSYGLFISSPVGWLVLFIEFAGVAFIFFVFEKLKKLPPVRF